MQKKKILIIGLVLGLLVIAFYKIALAEILDLSGYAWSDTIGWLHFNPSPGGVALDSVSGDLAGYAWSENIGWVSFDRSSGFPEAPLESAKVDYSTCVSDNICNVTGWAKALAGESAGAGGWDGWIKMSGSWDDGITYDKSSGEFEGYAWGSDVVGWMSMKGVGYGVVTTVAELPECSDGIDNDGDGFIDLADPDCSDPNDDSELPTVGPDFNLVNDGPIFVTIVGDPGTNVESTHSVISITSLGDFTDPVQLSVLSIEPSISGYNAYFSDASLEYLSPTERYETSEFWIDVPPSTPSGLYRITIQGDADGLIRTTTIQLNIEYFDEDDWDIF